MNLAAYAVADRIATIKFNNPQRMNAWSPEMDADLRAAFAEAGRDDGVRAIVLTGEGRAFCAGREMGELMKTADGTPMPAAANPDSASHDLTMLFKIGKPIIAAINGATAGVGFCYAAYCDFRYVAEEAKVTTAWARRGLSAEFATAWLLPRLVGVRNALDILLTGRTMTGAELDRLGFATAVPGVQLMEKVYEAARDFAERCSPRAIRIMKRQVYDSLFFSAMSQALEDARREGSLAFASEDAREGIAHFMEKRAPAFTGR
ncbi:MAG: enoyl-CoA hydratase-related protein [Hyphomonadaceae bacterium]